MIASSDELVESSFLSIFEMVRWPNGPICGHCGSNRYYRLSLTNGRVGVLKCRKCRRQFSVTTGTIFSGRHLPFKKFLMALEMINSENHSLLSISKKLGITYKTIWLLSRKSSEWTEMLRRFGEAK